jgi:hypothetical protein
VFDTVEWARRGTISQVTSRPAAAQHLCDLARLRRVRDRIDREYAQPLDAEALARDAHRRNDVGYGGMRSVTVGPADRPGTSISGLPVRLRARQDTPGRGDPRRQE